MAVLPTGIGPVTGGYQISRSLRFNSADSAYLNRTFGAGNQKTWTLSAWVKRSALGENQIFSNYTSGTDVAWIYFNSSNELYFQNYESSNQLELKTTQVFRDVGAWGHLVVTLDTTQATSSNRAKLYWNGVQITTLTTATYPTQNADLKINTNGEAHEIGKASSAYFNGYMTEVNFIDGQALTPSSFGETDSATGVWKPKKYEGTYGTNGFFLKFADNSGTTSTTLGKDSSGNGNNWTPNNFSVTAGAGNDSMVDSPTAYGTDTGAGGSVRGNYCTWNPLRNGMTLSNGNLTASSANNPGTSATFGMTSGKWYWEVSPNNGAIFIGIVGSSASLSTQIASSSNAWSYYGTNGLKYNNLSGVSYGATYGSGNVIGIAFDADAGTLVFYKDGVSQGTAYTGLTSGPYFAAISSDQSGTTTTSDSNFGQRAFAYTAPSGFKALCTTNLPTPTIGATSTTQANDYFDVLTYTGQDTNLNTNTIRAFSFQPGMVWEKSRVSGYHHFITDEVRTAAKVLSSSQTAGESSWSDNAFYVSINSDGVTLKGNTAVCDAGDTHVLWTWKANGAGSSNTNGTITSTVSANTTSGFSIVTYTGTGSAATVGHGLGVAPSMVIVKARTQASAENWIVGHTSIAFTNQLNLNTTAASAASTNFNSTTPTITVFSIGSGTAVNANTYTYVAYCFAPVAGYSAFGSYTGNGSTDGPFVFANHRPAFLLVKRTDTTSNWTILDFQREGYNVDNDPLFPNLSNAEGTTDLADLLSNGFKLRSTDASVNASGGTYIYMSLASNPFKFSLAR
jgi:hypothetical protein